MSTHRLDANILPWMAQTTPYRGRRANESRLQSYLPLRITSSDARRVRSTGDVCQCDSGQNWTVDGRITPRSRIPVGGGVASTRSTPDLVQRSRRAAATDARPAPSRPPPGRVLPRDAPFRTNREPAVYQTVSSPAMDSGRVGDERLGTAESVVHLPSALRKDRGPRQSSAKTVRVAFVDEAPPPPAAHAACAPIMTVAPAPPPPPMETAARRASSSAASGGGGGGHYDDVPVDEDDGSITDLLDFDYDDSDCSSTSSQSSVSSRANGVPARGGGGAMSRSSRGGDDDVARRPKSTPASSADGRSRASSASRGSQRAHQQRLRPHSAMASMTGNFYVSPSGQPLGVRGRSAGSQPDLYRQQSLVRLHRSAAAPPEPPQLAWMAIASSAHLHARPTSAKPKMPPARSPKRRVTSAPPRMTRSAVTPVPTLDAHDEEEEEEEANDACDSAPPSSPTLPPSSPVLSHSPSDFGDALDAELQSDADQSEGPPPPLEVEDIDDISIDEGYVGEADAVEEPPPPSPPAPPVPLVVESNSKLDDLVKRKSLQKAKFGAKKKQSLTDDMDLLNEYMRNRHRMKSSQTVEEDDDSTPAVTLSSKVSPSVQSCRFELPVSMDMLAGMRPSTYLTDYTLVIPRRQKWYDQAFNSADAFRKGKLTKQDAEQALAMIHVHAMQPEEIAMVMKVAEVGTDWIIDRKLFHGLAALSERILTKKMKDRGSDIQERELIERVDFNNLEFKLHGIKVPRSLRTLFKHIAVN